MRLTVSIQTRNSEQRIQRLIDEAYTYADEVIVGVDAQSTDRTFAAVSGKVDQAYRFRHPGMMAPARLLALQYASGDWILSLDDDESMEAPFASLRDELMAEDGVNFYYFPRKHLVSLDPCQYIRALPFYPGWQARLFRNKRSIVWKPPKIHTGYWIQGTGYYETRVSMLHYESLWCGPEQRKRKLQEYRLAGSDGSVEKGLTPVVGLPLWPAQVRQPAPPAPPPLHPRIHPNIHHLEIQRFPDWKAQFLRIEMDEEARRQSPIVAGVELKNVGTMSWPVQTQRWPVLNLAHRLFDQSGRLIQKDGERFPMPKTVHPGEEVLILAGFRAPQKKGAYILEWDVVSEHECWFQETGSATAKTPLRVA